MGSRILGWIQGDLIEAVDIEYDVEFHPLSEKVSHGHQLLRLLVATDR